MVDPSYVFEVVDVSFVFVLDEVLTFLVCFGYQVSSSASTNEQKMDLTRLKKLPNVRVGLIFH